MLYRSAIRSGRAVGLLTQRCVRPQAVGVASVATLSMHAYTCSALQQARLARDAARRTGGIRTCAGAGDATGGGGGGGMRLDPSSVEGTQRGGPEQYVLAYTCNVCEKRSMKRISKHSYHHGTVVVLCPHCKNKHLIADHLGIFEEDTFDLEQVMKERGEQFQVVSGEEVLEFSAQAAAPLVEEEGEQQKEQEGELGNDTRDR